MSRPLRIEVEGAFYHVMNRGLNRNLIFSDKKDYETFLSTLEEGCRLFNVNLYAYCLMPNHYHLLIRTPSGNISRFMRHLNGVYTQRYNRKPRRDGPLYRGRFKSILVQDDAYFIEVVRYIHKNPVKAKIVDRLSGFNWSSHKSYVGKMDSIMGLDTDFTLSYFSGIKKTAVKRYKSFMAEKESEEIVQFYGSKKQGSILGDADFIERIKEKLVFSDPDIEVTEKRKIRGEGVVVLVKREICRTFKVGESYLFRGKCGTENIPRLMALLLSKELSGLKLSELGIYFGFSNYRTVGTHCWRFRNKLKENKGLEKKYSSLMRICSQEKT